MVTLHAVIYSLRRDREGEIRLTLEVPLNQLHEAAKLCGAVETVMEVTFRPLESGVMGGTPTTHD